MDKRKKLDQNPIVAARDIQAVLDKRDGVKRSAFTPREYAANYFGVKPATISNYVRILTLTPESQDIVEHGNISFRNALMIAKAPKAHQARIADMTLKQSFNRDQIQQEINNIGAAILSHAKESSKVEPSSDVKRFIEHISEVLQTPVEPTLYSNGSGQILIKLWDLEMLSNIVSYQEFFTSKGKVEIAVDASKDSEAISHIRYVFSNAGEMVTILKVIGKASALAKQQKIKVRQASQNSTNRPPQAMKKAFPV